MRGRHFVLFIAVLMTSPLFGDEVIFKNGDRLTGVIKTADSGKLTIKTAVAGEVTVNMSDVKTFSTDQPITLKLNDGTTVQQKVTAGQQPEQVMAGTQAVPLANVKVINPPPQQWTGSIVVNGNMARGNTHSENIGMEANAQLRRKSETVDDRFTLAGDYNYGNNTSGGSQTTTTDNWFALGKYDRYFTEKWYGYGQVRYDHDRLADLNYRIAPGAGVGYQWYEQPDFHLSTEAGGSQIFEDYSTTGQDEYFALRFAYHVDKQINDKVSVFHDRTPCRWAIVLRCFQRKRISRTPITHSAKITCAMSHI